MGSYTIAMMPIVSIAKAAAIFNKLLINNFVCVNFVPIPISPQMRAMPVIYRGVIWPNNGKKASPAISPAINALMPNAMDKNISCFGLSIRKRFFPVLIFSVSSTILKAIMKQKIRTMTLAKPANLYIKVPPSSEPSQYSSPCPAAKAQINKKLRHQPLRFSMLNAVEAVHIQNVNAMTNAKFIYFKRLNWQVK